jgi:hypothetical protein
MRHAVHCVAIGLCVGLCVVALGCVSGADGPTADRAADLLQISHAQTWSFLKNDPPIDLPAGSEVRGSTYRVTSPLRDASALDADLSRYITKALETLGFERVDREADFYVNYKLILEPRAELAEGNFSSRFLASLSSSPSYIIESTEVTRTDFEDLYLEIDLREPRGRSLWRGELEAQLKALDALSLRAKTGGLLDRLPRSRAR